MNELAEFLLARIAEDEETAKVSLTEGNWLDVVTYDEDERGETNVLVIGQDRMLSECAAKRRLIEQVCKVEWAGYAVRDFTLETLAAVYADHADYEKARMH